MKNKITIKDVAREAGVSVATVSYVVNNRTDMRISEETRKKVLQVINLLNYTPNQSAQALATNRNRTVALYVTPGVSALKRAEQMYLIDMFSDFLHSKNYDLIYLSNSYTEKYDNADVIIGYDIATSYFHQIGDRNFRPFLALDCMIHDPLFFEVNSDYQKIADNATTFFKEQPYTLLILDTPNEEKKAFLSKYFSNVCYINNIADIVIHPTQNYVTVDFSVYELLSNQCDSTQNLYFQPAISTQKFETLFLCIEHALLRTPIEQHALFVAP